MLVVDDDERCRALLAVPLQRIGCTVYEASSGDEALEVAELVRPALVILDVDLPHITGYEVCRELRDGFGHQLAIMFVSGRRVEALDRIAGLLIGADDYLVKPFDPDELVTRARVLLAQRNRSNGTSVRTTSENPTDRLTAREREVLVLLARGASQNDIAAELVISPKTVATHIQRTLAKLGVHSRAQAVALAHSSDLLRDDVELHTLEPSAA